MVALPHDAPKALLQVAGPPWAIEIMQGDEPVLHIGSGSHFCGAAHEDTHLAAAHLGEQLLFLLLGVGGVDISDLVFRNAHLQQLLPQIVIHIEAAVRFGSRQVAENQLRAALCGTLCPYPIDIPGAYGNLAVFIVRCQRA